jgi:hypothetical protein
MKTAYDYFFVKLYYFMKRTPGGKTADDAALTLLLCVTFLYSSPFLFGLIYYVFGKVSIWVFAGAAILYLILLYKLNKRYFIERQELALICQRFKNESNRMRLLGNLLVFSIVIFSIPAFFMLLNLL